MQTDVLIIGSGIAGIACALHLAQDSQRQITVVTRASDPADCNSNHAQGGIISRSPGDSPDLLVQDIIRAGNNYSYPSAAQLLAEEGPRLVNKILIDQCQVPFNRDENGKLEYTLEAAHSCKRILHVSDMTGQAIMRSVLEKIKEFPNIHLLTNHTAVDLITFPHHSLNPMAVYEDEICHGAYFFNSETKKIIPILAGITVLATGGLGQIFLNTTNPTGARGDGLAMAYRAGAQVINAEYTQFHPTALYMPGTTKFLISEAVRGEGGVLLTPHGEPFMQRYSPDWKDLAPRSVVANAIYHEMLNNDYHFVLLDIASKMTAQEIQTRFPLIYSRCLEHNIDITRQPIPVVPAAHYFCGGVKVDLYGKTSLAGLYAVGEVSCTGLHGANRLASTSLLEALVWGDRAAQDICSRGINQPISENEIPAWDDSNLIYESDPALIQGDMNNIRNLMWHYVGLIRNEYRLNRAIRELRHLWLEIEEFYRKTRLDDSLIGLRNAVQVALIVAGSARTNRSSRGCHTREDFPSGDGGAMTPSGFRMKLVKG